MMMGLDESKNDSKILEIFQLQYLLLRGKVEYVEQFYKYYSKTVMYLVQNKNWGNKVNVQRSKIKHRVAVE